MLQRNRTNFLNFIQGIPELDTEGYVDREHPLWKEFADSIEQYRPRGNYIIYDHDLPIFRDLKAILNILLTLERMTESYWFWTAAIFKKLEYPGEIYEIYRNYSIFNSTESSLKPYLNSAKDYTVRVIIPSIYAGMTKYFIPENAEIVADYAIDKTITLEQYRVKYNLSKKVKKPDKKSDSKDDNKNKFVNTLIKNYDGLLKTCFKDDYTKYFAKPKKPDDNKSDYIIDIYPENDKENDTVKHSKLLGNGMIAINVTMKHYDEYQKVLTPESSSIYSNVKSTAVGASWIPTLVSDVKGAYNYLSTFDYDAIIAEQASPLAEKIKLYIKEFNIQLEKIACILDYYEGEFCLKDKVLLRYVGKILEKYKDVTSELRIPIDYTFQKGIYLKSRTQMRQKIIEQIDQQIKQLSFFLKYKDKTLAEIPNNIIGGIYQFIEKYNNDISMNRDELAKYKLYLLKAQDDKLGWKMVLRNPFEKLGNRLGFTIHSHVMHSFYKMNLYLQKQKKILIERLNRSLEEKPFESFSEKNALNIADKTIITTLEDRLVELGKEKEKLFDLTVPLENKKVEPTTTLVKTDSKIDLKPEAKTPINLTERRMNQISFKTIEYSIFSSGIEKYKRDSNLQMLVEGFKQETENLSPKSYILIDEIRDILKARTQAISISTDSKALVLDSSQTALSKKLN